MNRIAEKAVSQAHSGLPVNMVSGESGVHLEPETLGEIVRFGEFMSRSQCAVPTHLRDNAGACMAVAMLALGTRFNPFQVAQQTYLVKGNLAFQAQFITALVNEKAPIEGRLSYDFEGEGEERVCIVSATFKGETEPKIYRSPKRGEIKPKNSPLWETDPDQQHCYYSGKMWARRHCADVIMGVYDKDEADQMEPQKTKHSYASNLTPSDNADGFNPDFVENEINDAVQEQISEAHETASQPPELASESVVEDTQNPEIGSPDHILKAYKTMVDNCQSEDDIRDLDNDPRMNEDMCNLTPEMKQEAKEYRFSKVKELQGEQS